MINPVVTRLLKYMFYELNEPDRNSIVYIKRVNAIEDIIDGMMIGGMSDSGIIRIMEDIQITKRKEELWIKGDKAYYIVPNSRVKPEVYSGSVPPTGFPIRESDLERGIYRVVFDDFSDYE